MTSWARLIGTISIVALLLIFWRVSFTKETLASTEPPVSESQPAPALQATTTPTPTLSTGATLLPQQTPDPGFQSIEAASTFSFTLDTLGYDPVELSSPYDIAEYSFRLPNHWLIQDDALLNLDISYIYAQMASSDLPTLFGELSVFLDGNLVDTFFIENSRIEGRQLRVLLPAAELNDSPFINIDLLFNADFLCEVPHEASLVIRPTSSILLNHTEIPLVPDISTYPQPFIQDTFTPNIVRFVLPPEPDTPDVANAVTIAAKLANLRGNALITPTTSSELREAISSNAIAAEEDHLFVIGKPQDNDLLPLLNDMAELPVSLHEKQGDLVSKGPVAIAPGDPFTHVFTITNTLNQNLDLTILNRLPPQTELLECASECDTNENDSTVAWNNISLAPDEEVTLSVTGATTDLLATNLIVENVLTIIEADSGPLNTQTISFQVAADTNDEQQVLAANQGDYFFMYNGQAVVESDGVIQEIVSPWNESHAILIITGLNDEAFRKASQAMSSEARFPGMFGPAAIVQEVLTPAEISEANPITTTNTFADLGYEERLVSGQFTRQASYRFEIPYDWALTNDAFLDLYFYHSQLIDYNESSLTVLVNNRPAVSLLLDEETAENGHLRVDLANTNVRQGMNDLIFQVDMSLAEECVENAEDQAWLLIDDRSSFNLAHEVTPVTDFSFFYFPLPFTLDQSLSNLLLTLPANPTPSELETTLALAARLGDIVDSQTIIPRVTMGDETPEAALGDYHIIAIGRPSRNPLIQQINDELPQPFIPGSDRIEQQLDDIIFRLPSNIDLGYLQLITSPWNEDRSILVVTGTTPEGMLSAKEVLVTRSFVLRGNLALIQDDNVNTIDTRELTRRGAPIAIATLVATTIPENPQTAATVTPSPVVTGSSSSEISNLPETSDEGGFPGWLIPLAGLNVLIVLAIIAFVGWRTFKKGTPT